MLTGPVFVELIDGQMVSRCAEEWREECLARHVLQLRPLSARQEWLADFEKKRGLEAANALKVAMTAQHARVTLLNHRD